MSTTCPRAVNIRIGVVTPRLPDLAADVEAVHARQHHVEHDEVVAAARRLREPGLAVAGRFDRIAFAREPIAERQPQARFVFDEQHARGDVTTLGQQPRRGDADGRSPGTQGLATAGSCTMTVVPSPGRLST